MLRLSLASTGAVTCPYLHGLYCEDDLVHGLVCGCVVMPHIPTYVWLCPTFLHMGRTKFGTCPQA